MVYAGYLKSGDRNPVTGTFGQSENIAGLLALSKFYLMQGDYAQAQTTLDLVKDKIKIAYSGST